MNAKLLRRTPRVASKPVSRPPAPKFRETLWFKKGELDAGEAQGAASDEDDLRPGAVDLLPIEDRYLDNGSLTRGDSVEFGIHSGVTQHMAPVDGEVRRPATSGDAGGGFELRHMVSEMRRGRRVVFAAMGAVAMALGLVVLFVVL